MLGLVILATANFFVPVEIAHPFWMIAFLVLTATTFCLFGFIIGIWAKGFEQLQFVPMLVITPLTFLGGAFYSIDMLPRGLAHVQPVQPGRLPDQRLPLELLRHRRRRRRVSLAVTLGLLRRSASRSCAWIFRTGYRLKS